MKPRPEFHARIIHHERVAWLQQVGQVADNAIFEGVAGRHHQQSRSIPRHCWTQRDPVWRQSSLNSRVRMLHSYKSMRVRSPAGSRWSRHSSINVLLIEAGDWDTAPQVLDPGQWFTNLGTERDWGDVAIP